MLRRLERRGRDRARRFGVDALELEREHEPLDAGAEADARRRRPADLLDEIVVAAAAADRRRLRALVRADELERRARVVVEPADERRVERVPRRRRRRGSRAPREVLRACVAERLADLRRILRAPRARRSFFTSKTRSGLVARFCARVLVEHVCVRVEPRVQLLDVRGPAVAVADRVQPQLVLASRRAVRAARVELDHLGVDRRVGRADRLERELPVLAVAAALRAA